MPHKFSQPAPVLWLCACDDPQCHFKDRYADVVADHEHRDHGRLKRVTVSRRGGRARA